MPLAAFAQVLLLTRSQIKMSLSTAVKLDALTSDTISTRGNDSQSIRLNTATLFSNKS